MSVASDLADYLMSLFAPVPSQTVTEWAKQSIYLPASVTATAGQYSTAHCAYIRELLEDFRNPYVSESANCFAAQVYKTTGVFIGIGYCIDQQPATIIMVLPTYKQAVRFSQTKWQPMLEASPALASHKPREQDKFKIPRQSVTLCNVRPFGTCRRKQQRTCSLRAKPSLQW